MPLIAAILGGLAAVMGSLVGRVLLALGISYVTFTGLNVGIDSLTAGIKSNMQSMGGDAVRFMSYMWLDKGLSMTFSAWVTAFALKTAGSTTIKKMVMKG